MKKINVPKGTRFGRWTILEEASPIYISGKPRRRYKCQCDCGNIGIVRLECLRNGHSTSCGCLHKQRVSDTFKTHGMSDNGNFTPLYDTWRNMKKRCNNPNTTEYNRYGGRGIKICKEWATDFQRFYDWAISNGYKEGLTIDRINNDGNYEPDNCRFVTMKVQGNNNSHNHYIEYNGTEYTLSTLSDALHIPYNIVRYRISHCGYNVEQLINYYNNDSNKNRKAG